MISVANLGYMAQETVTVMKKKLKEKPHKIRPEPESMKKGIGL